MSYSLIEDEGTQLCDAIFSGETTDVQVLIDTGVDINSINKTGETPLHVAVSSEKKEIVHQLLAAGAKTNIKNQVGQTPLHLAASNGSDAILQLILSTNNCDLDHHTKYSEMTALHLASMNGHQHSVELLLESGADGTIIDAIEKTPDFYAATKEISDLFSQQKQINLQENEDRLLMEYLDNLINKPSKEAKSIQNTEHKSDTTDERHYQDYTKSVISEAKHTNEVKDVQHNVNEDKTFGKKQNITIQQKKEPILMTSSKVPTRSLEKKQQNFSEKKQTNSGERSSQKVLQNKLIKSGERNQQKLSEKESINPGERNQLKHTEKKQIKPGERNQQKHTEKKQIKPRARNQQKLPERKLADSKPNFSKQHQTRMQMNVFERLTQQKPPTKK